MFGFCKCGGLLMPAKSGAMKCRKCGKEQEGKADNILKTAHEVKEVAVIEKEESTLPTIERECSKCGNSTCYYWFIQTRASDEPPTRFFRCTKCRYTWREYS